MEYEDRLTISTPEGVDLSLSLAGIGSRCAAAIVDATIQSILTIAFFVVLGLIADLADSLWVAFAAISVVSFLIVFGYDIAWEVWGGGRTPGKRVAGLRVVRSDGSAIGFRASAVRNLLRLVDFLPTVYAFGLVAILATRDNQRLGDLAAGTVVIHDPGTGRRRRSDVTTVAPRPRPAPPGSAAWDVSAVTADDLATLRSFLERRGGLTAPARAALAADLAARLRPKVGGVPHGDADEDFLAAVAVVKASRR